MSTENLKIWKIVEETDPSRVKEFSRSGGFKGTAINPTYNIRKATELWGPLGGNWGFEIFKDDFINGAPLISKEGKQDGNEVIHVIGITFFYPEGKFPVFGQTTFVGSNKYGYFTDEEAPKKSLTDAISKALSMLGFSADIHMGLYDDNKYVNDLRQKFKKDSDKKEYTPPSGESAKGHKLATNGKVTPSAGAMDSLEEELRAEINDAAVHIANNFESGMIETAYEIYDKYQDADERAALRGVLSSKVRSGLLKFYNENKKAAA